MYSGSIPATSIYATWAEAMEIRSADDDELVDLSGLTAITLKLKDVVTRFDELVLTMADGDITLPSTGIIQWRVLQTRMGAITPKTYEVVLTLEDGNDVISLILGTVALVE